MADQDHQQNRYSRRRSLSADYTNPEPESRQKGVTNRSLPKAGSRKAAIFAGLLAAVVVGFLLTRMPFLAGSLNAGAPVDEMVTGSVEPLPDDDPLATNDGLGNENDASSSMPTPNELTPSTVLQQ